MTEVNLSFNKEKTYLFFKIYPSKGWLFRNTLIELKTPGLDNCARPGKKDFLYFGPIKRDVKDPDGREIQKSERCFLKLYPRATEMSWIIGIIGAKKIKTCNGPYFFSDYSPPRRESDFICGGGLLFFRINDNFITVPDLDKRRAVFPNEPTLIRYQHFFRSYPLKPNRKRRKHWIWG